MLLGEWVGYLPWGIAAPSKVCEVAFARKGDGGQGRTGFFIAAVWPLVGYGLGPGRRRFASNMPRICCAFAITSMPARDADVMALLRGHPGIW